MIAIIGERAKFVAIVLARDRQNWQRDFLKLFNGRHHGVIINVGRGMFEDALKIDGGISDKGIERLKGNVFFVSIEKFGSPEFLVAEEIDLAGFAGGKCEPAHVVGFANVIKRGVIEWRMRCSDRHDCGEVWRKFLGSCPLIEAGVGATPHRHFAVAERLLGEPFNDVVTIVWFLREWFEVAAGIAAAAHIDEGKDEAVRGEISAARVIRVGDVRRECKDDRIFLRVATTCCRSIKRGVQFYFVAHRNFDRPAQFVIGWRGRGRFGRRLGRSGGRGTLPGESGGHAEGENGN